MTKCAASRQRNKDIFSSILKAITGKTNVQTDLEHSHFMVFLKEVIQEYHQCQIVVLFKNADFKKNQQTTKSTTNFPACKEFKCRVSMSRD